MNKINNSKKKPKHDMWYEYSKGIVCNLNFNSKGLCNNQLLIYEKCK